MTREPETALNAFKALALHWGHYGGAICARMTTERARDLSDSELQRTLGPCVLGKALVRLATDARNAGLLTLNMIERGPLWEEVERAKAERDLRAGVYWEAWNRADYFADREGTTAEQESKMWEEAERLRPAMDDAESAYGAALARTVTT